jgi:hypothetical protein
VTFKTTLFRIPGPGGWTFARVPDRHAPPVTHGWGRTPVHARLDGVAWETSVWRDQKHGTLLPVPRHVRGDKGDGDVVEVELSERDGSAAARPALSGPAPGRRPRGKRAEPTAARGTGARPRGRGRQGDDGGQANS